MTSRHSPASVMLISDDQRLLRMMTWILLEAGHHVWNRATVEEAMRHSQARHPDIIVLDGPANVPKNAIIEQLRAAYTEARFIDIHLHGEGPHRHISAEGYLHRPFHADDLLTQVEQARGQPVGATSNHKH